MSWCRFIPLVLAASLSTVVAYGKVHDVTVGKDGKLTFVPDNIVAEVGDLIKYQFFPKNHSVVQSSFDNPCQPLSGGIFSGFVPTKDPAAASATTFTIQVTDNKPLWIYCSQTAGNHCQSGMVQAINAPSSGNTLDAFREKAKTVQTSTSPAEGRPKGGMRRTNIQVGPAGSLTFAPNNITALVGEVIRFNFNPKNHSVVESNFANPCQPLEEGGFSSGFVPTVLPTNNTFEIIIKDTKPVWFYCAQNAATHCQSGMVGSVNAPLSGNTIEAFIALAAKAPPSTIQAEAPLNGRLSLNGVVTDALHREGHETLPKNDAPPATGEWKASPDLLAPGDKIPQYVADLAGGYQPESYNWAPELSEKAAELLQLLNWVDNVLVEVLIGGHNNLTTGAWKKLYPETITNTVGSMGAQALVHRSTSTDSLVHYSKQVIGKCGYIFQIVAVEDFVKVGQKLILLEIALLLDIIATVVATDPWMIPCLASTLGSKSRMAGMINMMQAHIPAAAPREAMLPAEFVYSYVSNHYILEESCPDTLKYKVFPPLAITNPPTSPEKLSSVAIAFEPEQKDLWMAWVGPWGKVWYTPVVKSSDREGKADVPQELSGHVWGILTNKKDVSLRELKDSTVAGPEMVWV